MRPRAQNEKLITKVSAADLSSCRSLCLGAPTTQMPTFPKPMLPCRSATGHVRPAEEAVHRPRHGACACLTCSGHGVWAHGLIKNVPQFLPRRSKSYGVGGCVTHQTGVAQPSFRCRVLISPKHDMLCRMQLFFLLCHPVSSVSKMRQV